MTSTTSHIKWVVVGDVVSNASHERALVRLLIIIIHFRSHEVAAQAQFSKIARRHSSRTVLLQQTNMTAAEEALLVNSRQQHKRTNYYMQQLTSRHEKQEEEGIRRTKNTNFCSFSLSKHLTNLTSSQLRDEAHLTPRRGGGSMHFQKMRFQLSSRRALINRK